MTDNPSQPDSIDVSAELQRILHLAEKMTAASTVNRQVFFQLAKSPVQTLLQASSDDPQNADEWKTKISKIAEHLLLLRNLDQGKILKDCTEAGGDCPFCGTFLKKKSGPKQNSHDDRSNSGKTNWYFYCPDCIYPLQKSVDAVAESI